MKTGAKVAVGTGIALIVASVVGLVTRKKAVTGAANLSGVVTDYSTGARIPDVSVILDGTQSTSTNSQGSYSFSGLTTGAHTISFMIEGYTTLSKSITLAAGDNTMDVSLMAGVTPTTATLYGAVTDSQTGNPIAGITVTVDTKTQTTDSGGAYQFSGLTVGSYTITFEKSGYNTETETLTLVAGQNELNVQMTPVGAGAGAFTYTSDVRTETLPASGNKGEGIKFEVDIKNTGSAAGTCHPIALIETAYGSDSVDMGTTTISPGQTVTFKGQWQPDKTDLNDPDFWWRAVSITSEAGIITFAAGAATVSVNIPSQIQAGSEYQASAQVYLEYQPKRLYLFGVKLYFRGMVYLTTPSIYLPDTPPLSAKEVVILNSTAVGAYIGASEIPIGYRSYLLDSSRVYTIEGVWSVGSLSGMIKSAAKAIIAGPYNELQLSQILGYPVRGAYPDGKIPLFYLQDAAKGTIIKYDVIATLSYGTLVGPGGGLGEYAGFYNLWSKKIGEVEVVGGRIIEVVQKYQT